MNNSSFNIKLISAFAIVYFVWGSTYLAIKFVVQTLPPLTTAGLRFLIAGLILYGIKRYKGTPKPEKQHWKSAAIAGSLFFLIANGGIVLSLQYVDSGITALLVAMTPCWMVIIDRIQGNTKKTGWLTIAGLSLGLFGLSILFNPFRAVTEAGGFNLIAAGVIVLCSMSWAVGSIFVRKASLPESSSLSAAMQMISGGVFMLMAGFVIQEWNGIIIENISMTSIIAFIYLVSIGSIVAFTAYNWLLKNTTSAKAGTSAYVNPIVAMILGVTFGGELLTIEGIISSLVIISGVVLISFEATRKEARMAPETQHL